MRISSFAILLRAPGFRQTRGAAAPVTPLLPAHPGVGLALAAASGALQVAPDATAPFPNKPVRIIVPVAPGGSADKLTRTLGERLSALWGQTVIVEDIAGASGKIGAGKVAKAAPDGYTLLQQGEGLMLNSILLRDTRSFVPVVKAVVNPQVLVVHPGRLPGARQGTAREHQPGAAGQWRHRACGA